MRCVINESTPPKQCSKASSIKAAALFVDGPRHLIHGLAQMSSNIFCSSRRVVTDELASGSGSVSGKAC
jgi:hypothetical protein